jgi:hypothetical protein
MPTAAGRANCGTRFIRNCAGRAHWQAVPGRAHPAAPRRLRATRRLAATERRRLFAPCDGACSWSCSRSASAHAQRLGACGPARAAPWRLRAPRLRRACTRRCRALRRRLSPRSGAAPDQGARGECGEGESRIKGAGVDCTNLDRQTARSAF